MPRLIVGEKHGRWEVLEVGSGKTKCRCDCGVVKMVNSSNLKSGKSLSCGCLKAELQSARAVCVDGVKIFHTKLYGVYCGMLTRCTNPKFWAYARYGGRGIKVCKRWSESFVNFVEDMGFPPDGHTLDRIDSNGDYCPENCRWATRTEQSRNLSSNRVGVVLGKRMCVAEAAEKFGVKYRTIMSRMNRGFSLEEAVFFKPDLKNLK